MAMFGSKTLNKNELKSTEVGEDVFQLLMLLLDIEVRKQREK